MVGQLAGGISAILSFCFFVGALFWLQWNWPSRPWSWCRSSGDLDPVRGVHPRRVARAKASGGSLGSLTEESLGNAALVQSYGREADAVEDYDRQSRGIAHAVFAGSRVRAVFLPLVDLAELIGVLPVVTLGVWALATDRLTLGGLLAFLTLLMQCYGPVRESPTWCRASFSATARGRADRGVARRTRLPRPSRRDRPPRGRRAGRPARRCIHLSRSADPRGLGPTLDVGAGERVAVVGASGAGKSTIARLLLRQLDPSSGTVTIDGFDVGDHTMCSVRAAVTPVLQEQLLLDASVRDNIAFARPDAPLSQVGLAAQQADAHAFIERLPQGYDTRIGQRGRSGPVRWTATAPGAGPRPAA